MQRKLKLKQPSEEWFRQVRKHHKEQRIEKLKEEVPRKILELQERELVREEMEANGVIPLTEQEMETMTLQELWEHLRQIRNAQNWGGPSLLGYD